MEKIGRSSIYRSLEGSGTLCLKAPSTGAASGSHQLSRGFRACKQPLVHPKKTKLLFSWDTFFGQKTAAVGVGDSSVADPAPSLPQEPSAHSSPCWQPGLCPLRQPKPPGLGSSSASGAVQHLGNADGWRGPSPAGDHGEDRDLHGIVPSPTCSWMLQEHPQVPKPSSFCRPCHWCGTVP